MQPPSQNFLKRRQLWAHSSRFISVAIGLVLGFFFFDRSGEVEKLQSTLSALRTQIAKDSISRKAPFAENVAHQNETNNASRTEPDSAKDVSEDEITERDIQEALRMNERNRQGEYILLMERPTDRKFLKSAIKDLGTRMASNSIPGLEAVFSQLGVENERSRQLQQHQAKIQIASLEAGAALEQLLTARIDYDKSIRELLNPEDYNYYRNFEEQVHARRELTYIEETLQKEGVSLPEAYQKSLINLIQQTQAFGDNFWHGPYDGLPEVAVGNEMVQAGIQKEILRLSQALENFRTHSVSAGIPEEVLQPIIGYYLSKIEEKKQSAANIRSQMAGN